MAAYANSCAKSFPGFLVATEPVSGTVNNKHAQLAMFFCSAAACQSGLQHTHTSFSMVDHVVVLGGIPVYRYYGIFRYNFNTVTTIIIASKHQLLYYLSIILTKDQIWKL